MVLVFLCTLCILLLHTCINSMSCHVLHACELCIHGYTDIHTRIFWIPVTQGIYFFIFFITTLLPTLLLELLTTNKSVPLHNSQVGSNWQYRCIMYVLLFRSHLISHLFVHRLNLFSCHRSFYLFSSRCCWTMLIFFFYCYCHL